MSTEGEAAPEVTEVVEPVVTPPEAATNAEETTADEEGLPEDKARGKSAEARIAELTRARRTAERERDYYKGLATPSAPNSSQDAVEPNPDNFDNNADYVKALATHAVRAEHSARAAEARETLRNAEFSSKLETARTTITDYADVVDKSEVMVSDHVREALVESDKPGELLYHLAKHPDLVDRLNSMGAIKAASELGRLEASLAAPPAPRTSNAPAPAGTLRTTGSAVPVDLANADMESYIEQRRKQGARF